MSNQPRTDQEEKKEKKQAQDQRELTYDPNNPDPFRKRAQLSVSNGIKRKKKDKTGDND